MDTSSTKQNFVHLHVHTEFSILDAFGLLTRLCDRLVEIGFPACAITDHGSISGVLQFSRLCKKRGIKPIIGSEFYMVEDRFDKPTGKTGEERKKSRERDHIVLLAKTSKGYRNLVEITTKANLEGSIPGRYGKAIPRADWDLLQTYSEGLIALTACTSGVLARPLLKDEQGEAEARARKLIDIYKDDLYVELQPLTFADQKVVNIKLYDLAKKFGIKIVATNDSHYIETDGAETQDILLCVQTKQVLDNPERWSFDERTLWLKTREEMEKSFAEHHGNIPSEAIREALDVTLKITDEIEFSYPDTDVKLPDFRIEDTDVYEEFLEWQKKADLSLVSQSQ